MAELIKELVAFLKAYLTTKALGTLVLSAAGIYIWYQHLRNRLLTERLEAEREKGQDFLQAVYCLNATSEAERRSTPPSAQIKERILLVDDERMLLEILPVMLQLGGSDPESIETASDGEEALEKMVRNMPSLLITDIAMPRLDGISLLKALQDKGLQVPTLVISGYYIPDKPEAFSELLSQSGVKNHGSILFLQKPFNYKDLSDMIGKLTSKTRRSNNRIESDK